MVNQGQESQALTCPSCGALLKSDAGEQFFCEFCGSPLPGEVPGARVPTGRGELRDWRKEAAELPDWLQEATEADWEDPPTPVKGIELRPATPPSPEREAPKRSRSAGSSALVIIAILLGLLCLAGGILFAVLVSREQSPTSSQREDKVVVISAQDPWQDTGIRVRDADIVSIAYQDGTWGVWGGSRSNQTQAEAAGFEGEYRAVGVPLSSAPVGALLRRIDEGTPFLLGRKIRFRAGENGFLELMINDQWLDGQYGGSSREGRSHVCAVGSVADLRGTVYGAIHLSQVRNSGLV